MALEPITREEFDQRLAQSTERMRRERLTLEAQAAALEDLIGQYSSILERLQAKAEEDTGTAEEQRSQTAARTTSFLRLQNVPPQCCLAIAVYCISRNTLMERDRNVYDHYSRCPLRA